MVKRIKQKIKTPKKMDPKKDQIRMVVAISLKNPFKILPRMSFGAPPQNP